MYHEFRLFLEEYFLGTKYDDIDIEQRNRDEQDEILKSLKRDSLSGKGGKYNLSNQKNGQLDRSDVSVKVPM